MSEETEDLATKAAEQIEESGRHLLLADYIEFLETLDAGLHLMIDACRDDARNAG